MALLTIDDVPSARFGEKLEWLTREGFPAVLFCWGEKMEGNEALLVQAIEAGFVLANHSWSHPRFSELTWDQATQEIVRTEDLLEDLYRRAGMARRHRSFRFPYLDPGSGAQEARLQGFLAGRGYQALPGLLPQRADSGCTFDQQEYWLGNPAAPDGLDRAETILAKIGPGRPAARDVVLIHDHEYSHELFFECLTRYRALGLTFESAPT